MDANKLSARDAETLLEKLEARFQKYTSRHEKIKWKDVKSRLESNSEKLWSLYQMEESGGEPDVIETGTKTNITFFDCSPESPAGRRSICFDPDAWDARKDNKPHETAVGMARAMGVELLTESEYRHLQQFGAFDLKTSSWIQTPDSIRKLGGALFCDRRYDTVFTYHNGAQSYYAARGFRALINI
ncbi:MAG: DUF4256 domain-containing protein [Chitinophagaceae bacterium]|nr:MAG: DUF4256 domain-containing protein [Chitinophagaceae bacterium]